MGTAIREPMHAASVILKAEPTAAALAAHGFTAELLRAWAAPRWAAHAATPTPERARDLVAFAIRAQKSLDIRAARKERAARTATTPAAPTRCTECGAPLNSVHNHMGGAMPSMCFDCA